ncbi:MAG TPA: lactate utilization protein, partial [Blastocatellia bacterium]
MSKIAREEILSRIAGALKHESSRAPGAVSNGSRQAAQRIEHGRELERGELITQFENELRAIGGRFYSASSAGAACEYVQRLIAAGLKRAVAWDCQIIQEMGLAELFEQAGGELVADIDGTSRAEFIRKATEADVCITAVDYALADTGTLVLLTGQGRARAASLLAPVHVALVRCEQVVAGLTDLFALL